MGDGPAETTSASCREEPPTGAAAVRVLLVRDDAEAAERLLAALTRDPRVEAVGWAQRAGDALRLALLTQPDLVLVDTTNAAGEMVAELLCARLPELPVVLVHAGGWPLDAAAARRSGAAGYVTRSSLEADPAETVVTIASFVGLGRGCLPHAPPRAAA